MNLLASQVALEKEAYGSSMDNYDRKLSKAIENGSFAESKETILIIKVTIDRLAEHIEEFYGLSLRGNTGKAQRYLKDMLPNPRDCALLLIRGTIAPLIKSDRKSLWVATQIEKVLFTSKRIAIMEQTKPKLMSYIEKRYKHLGEHAVKRERIRATRRSSPEAKQPKLLLGAMCIDLVHQSGCGLIDVYKEGTTVMLGLSSNTKELLLRSKFFFGSMLTVYYPLIYPPKKWDGIEGTGGYYSFSDIPFIKLKNAFDKRAISALDPNLERLQHVVNRVQGCPYKINKRVLKTVDTIIKHNLVDISSSPNNPILYGGIPYMDVINTKMLIVKEDYGELDDTGKFLDKESKHRWLRAVKEQEIRNKGLESKRLQYKLALDIAHKFKEYDRIYFSYQLDFRGRLYPIQNFLNPQTSNNIKPLLEFAEGHILDEGGLYWLKIHGANCYGYDKLTYKERVTKIEEMQDSIKKIANDPIGNLKLWYNADAPLMFLAFCYVYSDYLNDPETRITIPIHLDATCSGLQMYSGLLKDKQGAECVNVLSKGGGVNDIYQDVADKVNEYLRNGDYPKEITYKTKDKVEHRMSTTREALSITGKINRKHTKRNVMTQPYSVTERGMYQQVYDLLTEDQDNNDVWWEGDKFIVAKLISSLNAKAIREVVSGARTGQDAVKKILRKSLETEKQALWFTPIYHFPVLQRIMREKEERLRTPLGRLVLRHPTKQVHYMRMLNGIAPNFIHSLDATLLYLTVEKCMERDVSSFWLIHDSYGVLPNDVYILNHSFREAFVELFEANPLKDFADQLIYGAGRAVDKIMVDTLDLQEVYDSEYIIC